METDKCKTCKIRIEYGRLFSEYWSGEKDCPYRIICKKEATDGKPRENEQHREPRQAEGVS